MQWVVGYCLISIPVFFGPAAEKRAAKLAGGVEVVSTEPMSIEEGKSVAARTESTSLHYFFAARADLSSL